jgi:hypothetical protein
MILLIHSVLLPVETTRTLPRVIPVVRRFRPIDAAFALVLICAYTGKEVV